MSANKQYLIVHHESRKVKGVNAKVSIHQQCCNIVSISGKNTAHFRLARARRIPRIAPREPASKNAGIDRVNRALQPRPSVIEVA